MIDSPPNPVRGRRAVLTAIGFGFVAVVYFVLLSGWMDIVPGAVMVQRQNVLFNSDTNLWIDEMIYWHKPLTLAVHPLDVFFWRMPCQALYHVLRLLVPVDLAGVLAARVLVALVAGTGVGFLAFVALESGMALAQCVLLFAMYLLFTSSCTIALPEHFGISNGLLSIAFAVPLVVAKPRAKTAALSVLAGLCGGTTITNVLYPLGSLLRYGFDSVRTRRVMVATATIALVGAVFLYADSRSWVLSNRAILPKYVPAAGRLYLKTTVIHIYVTEFSECPAGAGSAPRDRLRHLRSGRSGGRPDPADCSTSKFQHGELRAGARAATFELLQGNPGWRGRAVVDSASRLCVSGSRRSDDAGVCVAANRMDSLRHAVSQPVGRRARFCMRRTGRGR